MMSLEKCQDNFLLPGGESALSWSVRAENKSAIIASSLSFFGVEMTVELVLFSSINISAFSSNCGHTDPEGNVTGRLGLLKTNNNCKGECFRIRIPRCIPELERTVLLV